MFKLKLNLWGLCICNTAFDVTIINQNSIIKEVKERTPRNSISS